MTPTALVEWARQAAEVEFGDDDPMVRLLRSCADLIEKQDATLTAIREAHQRRGDYCDTCGGGYPCYTLRILDGVTA